MGKGIKVQMELKEPVGKSTLHYIPVQDTTDDLKANFVGDIYMPKASAGLLDNPRKITVSIQ